MKTLRNTLHIKNTIVNRRIQKMKLYDCGDLWYNKLWVTVFLGIIIFSKFANIMLLEDAK